VFYSVIETRDFSLFNQSAQALLKGYFIKICITLNSLHGLLEKSIKTALTSYKPK
jgi:hypothetical protein